MNATITIVGAGPVGANLAEALAGQGAEVRFGARDASSAKVRAATDKLGLEAVPLAESAASADFLFLAVPFRAVGEIVAAIGSAGPTVVVDVTNPVGQPLPPGAGSTLDVIAAANPDAALVKAFNTIGAEAYLQPTIDGRPLFLPIAGDADAADGVCDLASSIGFDALVIGDRSAAGLLESHAELWIHLAFRTGLGRNFGFARLTG